MASLSLAENRKMVFKAGESAGKSGSFFFFSHDNKFLIKTMQGNEKKIMLQMLDDYVLHIKSTKNRSLIARIYGIYKIKSNYFTDLDVLVMQNTSNVFNNQNNRLTFDLKGS